MIIHNCFFSVNNIRMGSAAVDVGLLVIRGSEELIRQKLQRLLRITMPKVRQKLYVRVEEMKSIKELLPAIYLNASTIESRVDLRVILDRQRKISVDRVFYDEVSVCFLTYCKFANLFSRLKTQDIRHFQCYARKRVPTSPSTTFLLIKWKSLMSMWSWVAHLTDCTMDTKCCFPRLWCWPGTKSLAVWRTEKWTKVFFKKKDYHRELG